MAPKNRHRRVRCSAWREVGVRVGPGGTSGGVAEHHPHCGMLARGGRLVGVSTGAFEHHDGWPERLAAMSDLAQLAGEIAPRSAEDLADLCEHLRHQCLAPMVHLSVRITSPDIQPADVSSLLAIPGAPTMAVLAVDPSDPRPERWGVLGAALAVEVPAAVVGAERMGRLTDLLARLPEAGWQLELPRDMAEAETLLDAYAGRLRQVSLLGCGSEGTDDTSAAVLYPLRISDLGRYARVLARCAHVGWIVGAIGPSGRLLERAR